VLVGVSCKFKGPARQAQSSRCCPCSTDCSKLPRLCKRLHWCSTRVPVQSCRLCHPDDETLAAGALADAGARKGIEQHMVYLASRHRSPAAHWPSIYSSPLRHLSGGAARRRTLRTSVVRALSASGDARKRASSVGEPVSVTKSYLSGGSTALTTPREISASILSLSTGRKRPRCPSPRRNREHRIRISRAPPFLARPGGRWPQTRVCCRRAAW
jgi:hypothetical protein